MVQAHPDSRQEGTTKPIPPLADWNDLAWVLRSSISFKAAPSIALLHHFLVFQQLGLRLQGTTEGSAYGPVHHRGQASCHPGLQNQAVLEEGPKNCQTPATLGSSHPTSWQAVPEHQVPPSTLLLLCYCLCIVTLITLPTCTYYLDTGAPSHWLCTGTPCI